MQNEVVKVNDKRIVAVEWNGERVITTAQLADVYETSADNVRVNFNNNKDRFTENITTFSKERNCGCSSAT
jgi:hypothetical protein